MLGKLGFIAVAQSAGFKLSEIRQLIDGVDSSNGMDEQMRALSARKLDEVEARELGGRLNAHIRFEERELFPLLERRLHADELHRLGQAVIAAEQARP